MGKKITIHIRKTKSFFPLIMIDSPFSSVTNLNYWLDDIFKKSPLAPFYQRGGIVPPFDKGRRGGIL
jgi:hypothetical protein